MEHPGQSWLQRSQAFFTSHQVQGFSSWHSLRKFRTPKNDNPSDNLAITICWKLAPGKEGGPVTGPKPFQQKMFRSIEVVTATTTTPTPTTTTTTTTTIPAAATTTTTTTIPAAATTSTTTTTTTSTTTTTTSMTYDREGWCRNPVKRMAPPKKR